MSLSRQFSLTWTDGEQVAGEDDRIIARCLQGEDAAYTALYDKYAAYIYRLSYSLLQHREDAEEVLQDTFDYAFRKLRRYDSDRASFKTWLYQIAVSRSHNKRRRKWLPTLSLNLDSNDGERISDTDTPAPDEHLLLTARQKVIWQALGQLSPKLRATAVLRYYEGLTYPEIGQILGIPAKTVESRMRLAHQALKEILKQRHPEEFADEVEAENR